MHVFGPPCSGGFKKCFWLLVMMGMASALLYNLVEMTRKFLDYPVSVKLSIDHQHQLAFPSVTVCNMSPVKRSAFERSGAVGKPARRRRKRAAGRSLARDFLAAVNNNNNNNNNNSRSL